ncbi:rRNA maturation RNase YbeY [Pontibacter sp. G13]|uniref:rRNA maturation RNase YbeY n=1 Tax=Pontibacter sp. G13 TaxID=3074898 RepID=UPI00288B6E22|nr:rRNA maturation RNase YbeY [Pontibacter sp. G13]WNJ15918.1 rRNA maturation RNase YbeY [Pontibacter sp. G13]
MEETSLQFFYQDIDFTLDKEDSVKNWILFVVDKEGRSLEEVNYIFCSDEYLLKLNEEYLQHTDYTDILTFPNSPKDVPEISADIYISIDRIKENATKFDQSFTDELHRVMIHGMLHLIGYDDHNDADILEMRIAETRSLELRNF